MSKALFGTHAPASTVQLLEELQRLRARVAELEAALEAAEDRVALLELAAGSGPGPTAG